MILEALWLANAFHAPDASGHEAWASLLAIFNEGHHRTAAVLFGAALVLALSPNSRSIVAVLGDQTGYTWWPWALLHGLAIALFAWLTLIGFGSEGRPPALTGAWLLGWSGAGAAALLFWLFVLGTPTAWGQVAHQNWRNLAIALIGASGIWLGGLLTQQLWEPLADGTLHLSAVLLSFVYPEVSVDPVHRIVGTPNYLVEIFPVCSGYEGIALVSVFVAIYLWLFREDLVFPRALVLFPIGIVTIWLTNVVRVTALIVIGSSYSPEVAGQGFHSQAGWIAFTLVALGLIALSHRWLRHPKTHGVCPDRRRRPTGACPAHSPARSAGRIHDHHCGLRGLQRPLSARGIGYRCRSLALPIDVPLLFGPWSFEPLAIGVLVFAMWVLLVPGGDGVSSPVASRLADLPAWLAGLWVLFRLVGAVVTVPMAEELAFRGYLTRKLVASDFESVPAGHFTWFSFIASSLLFGLLHQHFLAGVLAGAAFAFALYRRGYVGDAIIAHMTSNALIAFAVLAVRDGGVSGAETDLPGRLVAASWKFRDNQDRLAAARRVTRRPPKQLNQAARA